MFGKPKKGSLVPAAPKAKGPKTASGAGIKSPVKGK